MLKNLLRSARLTHISMALVGLMWVIPFLNYYHSTPLTTFYQEWSSALLGVLAITLLVSRDFWQKPEIPRIAQLPAVLIGVVLLQWGLGKAVYFDQALLYVLYLLLAALLMLLGARLRVCLGMAKLALTLAIFLLIGAELSALIGVLQHYGWHTPLDSVVARKVSASVYGNIAQPNHFANYVALGMISLGLLFQQHKLRAGYVALLAIPLLFVMTLSGSRSSWLYLLLMAGLAWWWARRDAGQRPLLRYCLLLIVGFGVMHLIVQLPFMAGTSNVNSMERLFGDNASGGIRLFLWREAIQMFMQSPWLGVGFGQFAWQHFQLAPGLHSSDIVGLYNNAHNLFFQLAAEAGVIGLLAFFVPLAFWFYGLQKKYAVSNPSSSMEGEQLRATFDTAHWWGYAALGVLAIHSLLEYPLWYVYFVAIAAILLGALDKTCYRLELRNIGRLSVVAIVMLGLIVLGQLQNSYRDLEIVRGIRSASNIDPVNVDLMRDKLVAISTGSLLSPYAELYMSSLIRVNDQHIKEKLELNTRVTRFIPTGIVVYRQALLLAQAGQQEQAKVVLEQALWSYPKDYGQPRRHLLELAEKDPAHFSALLEFALQKEQESQSAIHQ